MTREIIIPQSYVRIINVKKKRSGRTSVAAVKESCPVRRADNVKATVPVSKGEGTAIAKTNGNSAVKVFFCKTTKTAKMTGTFLLGVLCAVIYGVLSVIEALDFAWLCIQEWCGQLTRKIGTEGLFGEAKDGYYHTEDGFRLRASALTVVPRKK